MAREFLTDEQVDFEIERLTTSPAVQLARAEQRIRYRRRQYLYQLLWYEKRGKQLEADGVTLDNLELLDVPISDDGEDNERTANR